MIPKIFGALLIVMACGGVGFSMAAAHRQKERMLQQIIAALQYMTCELQYRQTALPQLMDLCSRQVRGPVSCVFAAMSDELERQVAPDAACCMHAALCAVPDLPAMVKDKLHQLGSSLGRFDLAGQLSGLESVAQLCKRELDGLFQNRDIRMRSYATLGFCAGTALAILFI